MKRQWIAAGCAAVLCSGSAWAYQLGTASGPDVGHGATVVAIGDLNGDQLDDLAVAASVTVGSGSEEHVLVYLQDAVAQLGAPVDMPFGATGDADIVLGDVNGDGIADAVVCGASGLMVVTRKSGAFSTGMIGGAPACTSEALVDVDGDGNLDIVAQGAAGNATVFHGAGTGAFSQSTMIPTGVGTLVAGDVNGDGRPDLVVFNYQTINLFLHDSGTNFLAARQIANPTGVWGVYGAAIGDFNHDGRQDLVLNQGGNVPTSAIWVYRQNADGSLNTPTSIPTGDIPAAMASADLDHDGRTDLLVGHAGYWGIGFHLQGDAGLVAEVRDFDPPYSESYSRALAAGDLDDDGCTDVAVVDSVGLQAFHGSDCVPARARADFNGDGVSDAVWRNASTGANAIWLSADPNPRFALPSVSLAWRIAAVGDFDGDGKADLLWHDDSHGGSVIWFGGDAATATALPRVTDTGWNIVGAGDVNGDGKDDVVWRHATTGRNTVWLSANSATSLAVAAVTDTHWKIVGVDDFDGDGRADLLWRHDATGANAVWPAADTARRRNLLGVTDLYWIVGGTGDFDGDGKADVFWRQTSTGANSIWRAGDATNPMRVATGGRGWQVVVGDYTGDRKADLLWRNPANGANVIWRAAQASVQRDVTDVTATAWRLAP